MDKYVLTEEIIKRLENVHNLSGYEYAKLLNQHNENYRLWKLLEAVQKMELDLFRVRLALDDYKLQLREEVKEYENKLSHFKNISFGTNTQPPDDFLPTKNWDKPLENGDDPGPPF